MFTKQGIVNMTCLQHLRPFGGSDLTGAPARES